MITAQKCNIKMKKCKILPFQNHQFNKNSVFGPFLSITRYYPQIWSIFCYIQLVLLVLPQKKWCELGAKPKKCHFSPIFGRYLRSTEIWCLRGSAVKKETRNGNFGDFLTWYVWGHAVVMITAQICSRMLKKVRNFAFSKWLIFGPYFAHFPLFPTDMIIFAKDG